MGLEPFTCREHLVKKNPMNCMFGIGEIHTGVKDRVRECLLPLVHHLTSFCWHLKKYKIKIHKIVMLHVLHLKHGPNTKGRTWNVS